LINGQIYLALATTSERTSINSHVHLTLALHKNSGKKDGREVIRATRRREGGLPEQARSEISSGDPKSLLSVLL
jgi:hypothetical protein